MSVNAVFFILTDMNLTRRRHKKPKNLGEMIEVKEDEIASSMTPTYLEKTYWSGSNVSGIP